MEYAGFWRRTGAMMLDTFVFMLLYFTLDIFTGHNFFLTNVLYQAACALYFIGMTASQYRGTIGQHALSIQIGTRDDQQLSIIQSAMRYIFWMLPAWPLVIYSSMPEYGATLDKMSTFDPNSDDAAVFLDFMQSPEVQSFMITSGIMVGIASIGGLIWGISIAVSKEKAGIHDLICKQRAFKK